ncbi:hypothetical protein WMF04_23860 [Sorangium sp. So ce260]|uniref:hypothetical protein n=1 Tax=Sorangium sp. So ce260 TaxID=3133291 RepID=UPI003F61411C
MSGSSSRYSNVGTAIWSSPLGEQVLYRQRRFLPNPATIQVLSKVEVKDGERIDQIAAVTLGNPLQWWRIADANTAMEPYALTDVPGVELIVPVPTA